MLKSLRKVMKVESVRQHKLAQQFSRTAMLHALMTDAMITKTLSYCFRNWMKMVILSKLSNLNSKFYVNMKYFFKLLCI